jgi:ubiquinone/menaquinone biosynthesis C-methylase UbiE
MNTVAPPRTAEDHEESTLSKALWPSVRHLVASLLRTYPWLAGAVVAVSGIALAASLAMDLSLSYKFLAATALASSSFLCGFWSRSSLSRRFPPLSHLHRRQYAATWDLLTGSREEAYSAAAGHTKDEAEFRQSAAKTVQNLLELAPVLPHDQVLEVGCGVARIGRELARSCATWTGADVSANMLTHAAPRLEGLPNVRLVQLHTVELAEFENSSFDVVYFTNMLIHLDEMDRWQYAQEAFRVLRPGGRIFMDIIDIESDVGWGRFARDAVRYKHLERPPYMPRFSNDSELTVYLQRAGFLGIRAHHRSPLVIVTGVKPAIASGNSGPHVGALRDSGTTKTDERLCR